MSLARPAGLALPRFAAWQGGLIALGLGLAVLGTLFAAEVAAAVSTWDRSSAYGHCWLVLPIAGWLARTRRDRLAGLAPEPMPAAAVLALGGAAAWLVAERLGVMEARQMAALGMVWVLVLATHGWRVVRAMAAPLAYLVFLVPFGEFATPWLQDITLEMILVGLRLLGIPHHADGLVIEIPEGTFLVAEACAGLRFLIAAIAFGALYALSMFRDTWRRLLVMVLAVAVPLAANGVRAFAIVLMGHHMGSAEAAAADHLVYGWVFFSVVMALLILAGLPFRQDGMEPIRPRPAAPPRPPSPSRLSAATLLALGLAAAGPVAASALDAANPPPRREAARLAAPAGCEAQGLELRCGTATLRASLILFAPGTNWSAVAAARRQAAGSDDEALIFDVSGPGMRWQGRQSRDRAGAVAVGAWLDGAPAGDGLRTRATQARNALLGQGGRPVVALVELLPSGGADPARELRLLRSVLAFQEDGLAHEASARSRR
ncbi:exosortase [Roseococcus sp. SYP-B2431]|uniref:exosortase A n=1 Tax=Roseococcus sp. SYP-B2431 TaxID=2496640 RepID=UPI00103F44E8|nr:exosortase A [Roseococcus sp. SYP-B2431]TCH96283.1 exosortase [Roseococcus sp. SYP-B2431]